MATHHDDGHSQQSGRCPLFEEADPIGVGHPDVEQDQVGPHALACLAGLGGVFGQLNLMTFIEQDFREQIADAQLVVHHQYVCHVACALIVVRAGESAAVLRLVDLE